VVAPRSAYFARTRLVEPRNAEGLISCDCVAPCPPGVPIVVPGSRITRSIIEQFPDIRSLRVMQET
ncbi:MAG: hypothetical protein K2Z81_01120, partial [Cyanobacteria bacterium]|nr:hypothetical protein [Cyanobacteriota bacterium]